MIKYSPLNNFTHEELNRYSRHFSLKDFGRESQEKLKKSSALIVGAGGLGCPVLLYLTAAGVGTIGIVDFDVVQVSNLQRQVLFTESNIGENKALAAQKRLSELNPFTQLRTFPHRLASQNALTILAGFSVIVDCSDNFPTRYLLNDACILLNKPLVFGSVLEYEGQVAVFNVFENGEYSANYRDIFPAPPPPHVTPTCEQAGVLGVLPGIIGCMQANETIKLLTEKPDVLSNKLLLFDSQKMDISLIHVKKGNSRDDVKELIDYELFCNPVSQDSTSGTMKEITVCELQVLKQSREDFQLIDVREEHEYETFNLDGELIPLSQIPHSVEKISKSKKVIIHCQGGDRSRQAILWLEKNHKFENLYNLKGGIRAWTTEINSTE